jgi:uncharacterized membrane protein
MKLRNQLYWYGVMIHSIFLLFLIPLIYNVNIYYDKKHYKENKTKETPYVLDVVEEKVDTPYKVEKSTVTYTKPVKTVTPHVIEIDDTSISELDTIKK